MALSLKSKEKNYTLDTKNIWFPSQREPLYDITSPILHKVFLDFWKRERDRCINGFWLNDKVRVTGWLYWHTVYWKIRMKKKINNRSFPVIETPIFRDIDWEAAENFERALDEGVFIELVGSRGFGKTVWQSSRAAWYFTFMPKSQVVVSGGNSGDIKTVTDMIAQGLMMIHPLFKKKWLKKDWGKEILAGFKTPDGEVSDKSSLSQILMKNYQDGNDSMAINGTRPDFHIIDEIGKIRNFIKCVRDSDGSYWANQEAASEEDVLKPTCLPFYTGTGGDMEKGKDAAEMFYHPGANHILSFNDKWENKGEIGWFMPVTKARMEYKEPMPFSKYLGIEDENLDKISILVSNEERCMTEWWTPRYNEAKSSGNSTALLGFLAYWPLKPSHAFIVWKNNTYNIEAAKAQQDRLRKTGKAGLSVELYNDGEKILHKFVDRLPITEFPVKTQKKDAPIQMYEFPMESPPFGLYVAGVDSYRMGKAKYSDSLGAVYIIKRQHGILGEKYQNQIVASYVARPEQQNTWNEQARMLIKMFNARTLVENDEQSFIEYMKNKGDAQYLEKQPAWIKEISPNSDVSRDFGIHRSSERIRDWLHACVQRYLDEVIERRTDDMGSVTMEILGVQRVPDPMLLQEVIEFDTEGNFDREVAFSLACAMAEALDGKIGKITSMEDPRIKALYGNKNNRVSLNIVGGSGNRQTTLVVATKKRGKNKLFI